MRGSSPALLHAAYLLTTDRGHAQDLVQDTYARVAQHWPRLQRHGGDPTAYARVVLYRLAIDRWRARGRRCPRRQRSAGPCIGRAASAAPAVSPGVARADHGSEAACCSRSSTPPSGP
ncbi:sigma factor [Nostocoides australiense]